jgi:outer membrane protein assembly factor BamA
MNEVGGALTPDEAKGLIIRSIQLKGLERTDEDAAKREVLLHEGAPFDPQLLSETLHRFLALRVFRLAEATLRRVPESPTFVDVQILLDEKWTLIPGFKYGQGGGTTFLALGFFNINWFGRLVEAGANYESYSGKPGGILWYQDPRFLKQVSPLNLYANLAERSKPIETFSQQGERTESWFRRRSELNLQLTKEWNANTSFISGMGWHRDRMVRQDDPLHKTESANIFLGSLGIRLGRLMVDDYYVSGTRFESLADFSNRHWGSTTSFQRLTSTLLYNQRLFWLADLAYRGMFGFSDADSLAERYSLGGLGELRGFQDGEFAGRHFWLSNVEIRVPSIRYSRWLHVQHVIFVDAGKAAVAVQDFGKDVAVSLGSGVRVICPAVYRLVFRIDYAVAVTPFNRRGLSFGMQQFF